MMILSNLYTQTRHRVKNAAQARLLQAAAGLLLLSLSSAPALAADEGAAEPRFYTVEIIAFSYEQPDENLSESWPEDIQLELPTAYQQLHTPADITSTLLNRKTALKETRVISLDNGETETREVEVGPLPLTTQQRVDIRNNRLPDLFLLPEDKLQLKRQRSRLERRDNLRILFHEAWKMPVYDKEHSTPIHIRGGEQYDNLYELEGSLRFSVARYLHLDTQLYLREFEASQSQQQAQSPELAELLSQQNSSAAVQASNPTPNPSLALLGFRQYRLKNLIPLQQSRRMRSGDLHYIDHPRYGLLVQLTPYDPEAEPIRLR